MNNNLSRQRLRRFKSVCLTCVRRIFTHKKINFTWHVITYTRRITSNKTERIFHRTQSNEFGRHRTIKFDVVRSSNEIELTKNKCKSNQIEHSIKSDEVRFSSVAERYLSERLTSYHNMIWIEQNRMFGFPSFDYHGEYKCVNRSSHLKLCFLYFHTYF